MLHPTQGDQKALGTAAGVNSRPSRVSVCTGAVLHAGCIGKRGLAAEHRPYNHPGVPQKNPKAQTPTQLCLMNTSRPSASMVVLMSTCLQPETSFTACSADMQNVLMHAHARALKPGRVHVPRRVYASFCTCRHAHIRAQARACANTGKDARTHALVQLLCTHRRTHACAHAHVLEQGRVHAPRRACAYTTCVICADMRARVRAHARACAHARTKSPAARTASSRPLAHGHCRQEPPEMHKRPHRGP
jgi:hypothetical protein